MTVGDVGYFPPNVLALVMMTPPLVPGREVRLPDGPSALPAVKPGDPLARLEGAIVKLNLEYANDQRMAPGAPFRPGNPFLRVAHGRILILLRHSTSCEFSSGEFFQRAREGLAAAFCAPAGRSPVKAALGPLPLSFLRLAEQEV